MQRKFSLFFRFNSILNRKNPFSTKRLCSTSVSKKKKREDYFFDQKVQSILKRITGLDYNIVFRSRPHELEPHKYEFVTDKQLTEMMENAKKRAYEKLQMPPVMDIREPIEQILSKDPELQGYLETKMIFTDTSSSKHSRNRIITVREIDGTLRTANWEERFRMNQAYFPIEGRSFDIPKFFESPHFDKLLEDQSYLFILDAACVQFEPDDPEYHRVTEATYEHIKSTKNFSSLWSTRHFGPMAFYFAYNRDINDLLVDMINRKLLGDAADTIKLMYMIHPDMAETASGEKDDLAFIQEYIERNKSPNTADLELALQSYIESTQLDLKEKVSV